MSCDNTLICDFLSVKMDRLQDHLLEEAKYSLHDQHLGKTLHLKKVIDLKFAFFQESYLAKTVKMACIPTLICQFG